MSINTVMDYTKLKSNYSQSRTIIAPCNPRDIRYCDASKQYFVNYVLKVNFKVKAVSLAFKTYRAAYAQMNVAREAQGFDVLPPFKTYKGE